jgi:hypothetical protein
MSGDGTDDTDRDVDGLVGHPQADLDPACGDPVLAGKDGAEHECLATRGPRTVSNCPRYPILSPIT